MSKDARRQTDAAVMAILDGSEPAAQVGTTLQVVTVDAQGRPRVALLSAGEVLAMTPRVWRLAVHAGTGTAAALSRAGARALVTLVHDGAHHAHDLEVTRSWPLQAAGRTLLAVEASVVGVTVDAVDYATLTSGLTYRLEVPQDVVVQRWRETLAALRGSEETG